MAPRAAQWVKVPRGFEPRSLDSESRVLTVTPQDQVSACAHRCINTFRKWQVPGACTVHSVEYPPYQEIVQPEALNQQHSKQLTHVKDPKMWQVRIELTTLGL